jgi:hypothetical protein
MLQKHSSQYLIIPGSFIRLLLYPEDGSRIFPRNIGSCYKGTKDKFPSLISVSNEDTFLAKRRACFIASELRKIRHNIHIWSRTRQLNSVVRMPKGSELLELQGHRDRQTAPSGGM